MWKLVMKLGHVKALLALSSAKQYQRFKVRSWPIASFRCAAELGRYWCIADSGKAPAWQIYGFTA